MNLIKQMLCAVLFLLLAGTSQAVTREQIDAYVAAYGTTAEWELRDYANGEPPVFWKWESTAPMPSLDQLPSEAMLQVPVEYRTFDMNTGVFSYKPDAEMLQIWTNSLACRRAAIRNDFVGNILGVVGSFGFTNLPIDWIEVSKYMIANQQDPDVQRYGTFLNAQALFYKEWGGNLFDVNFEDTTCPYLQGE